MIDRTKDIVYVFTDGSCNNKTGNNGGYGIVLLYKEHTKEISSDQYINSTSARCEILGVLNALKLIHKKQSKVKLYCDNQYVVKAISEKWVYRWEQDRWIDKFSYRKNHDLWKQVLEEYRKFPEGNVEFTWVRGHNNNKYNEIADKLAGIGARSNILIKDNEF